MQPGPPTFTPPPAESAPLLIPKSERWQFLGLFTLLSVIGGVLGFLVASVIAQGLPESLAIARPLERLLVGTVLGVGQWLTLRRYGLDRAWIVATGAGYIIATAIAQSLTVVGGLFVSLVFIALGATQWWVLRSVVQGAWRWILVPAIAFFLSSLVFVLVLLVYSRVTPGDAASFVWLQVTLQMLILGGVQAAVLTTLRRHLPVMRDRSSSQAESALSLAPEITDLDELRQLSNQLYERLDRQWHGELSPQVEEEVDLIYLVGVNAEGVLVMYQPINQAAIDYVEQTPLPRLMSPSVDEKSDERFLEESARSLARFQVILSATGGISIRSWRGDLLR